MVEIKNLDNLDNIDNIDNIENKDTISNMMQQFIDYTKNDNTNYNFGVVLTNLMSKVAKTVFGYVTTDMKNDEINVIKKSMKLFNNIYEKNKVADDEKLQTIMLIGYIKAMTDLTYLYDEKAYNIDDLELLHSLNNYKHVNDILQTLNNKLIISHKELAKELNISPNTLTNTLKRLEKYNLINSRIHGRNKYFILSHNGIRVYELLQREKKGLTSEILTSIIENLLDDFENIIQSKTIQNNISYYLVNQLFLYTTKPRSLEKKIQKITNYLHSTVNIQKQKIYTCINDWYFDENTIYIHKNTQKSINFIKANAKSDKTQFLIADWRIIND